MAVDANALLRVVHSGAILGGNLGIWVTPDRLGAPTDAYVRERGARVVRFPGGNLANNYCWPLQRVSNNDHVVWDDWSWGMTVEDVLAFIPRVGGVPMFSLNPFDHTIDGQAHSAAEEARELTRLMLTHGYAGAYYEVGNENDGSWNPMLSPEEYVERFIVLAEAVRSVDASAQMIGPVGSGTEESWRDGFIDGLAARGRIGLLDLFAFHYYGGWISGSNTAGVDLNSPQTIPPTAQAIRDKLASVGAPDVGVALTEYNAAIWDEGTARGQQTIEQGLWLADAAGEMFRSVDVGNVWIDLAGDGAHNLLNADTTPPTRGGNYWSLHLVGRVLGFGWGDPDVAVLQASSDLPTSAATVYAASGSDGRLGLLLVNKAGRLSVEIALANRPCSAISAWRLDEAIYTAATGPAEHAATCAGETITLEAPGLSAIGLVLD